MNKLILFDGDCNFCNGSTRFIMNRDPDFHYMFASLQSEVGQRTLESHGIPISTDSFIYINEDKWYSKSSAALHICRNLSGHWKVFYVLILIPKPIRDFIYNIIARNRYKWFGKEKNCRLLSPKDQERFL